MGEYDVAGLFFDNAPTARTGGRSVFALETQREVARPGIAHPGNGASRRWRTQALWVAPFHAEPQGSRAADVRGGVIGPALRTVTGRACCLSFVG